MEALLCSEGLNVSKTFVETEGVTSTVNEEGDIHYQHTHRAYVFYEWNKDKVIEESARLQKLAKYAQNARTDSEYCGLKNAKQREMYLLTHYGLPGKDAADVIELAKDEMYQITDKLAAKEAIA